jgi:hypothetical protein
MKPMKKLILIATIGGLCTAPAMAAGTAHPLLAGAKAASSSNAAAANIPQLPLPPLSLESSLTVPSFGKQADGTTKTINLPAIGKLTTYTQNDGKGDSGGQAKVSSQLDIDPNSTKQVTSLAADYSVPQKGQLSSTLEYKGKGYGKETTLDPKTTTGPLGGSFTRSVNNQGKAGSIDTVLNYTTPPPKSSGN